MFPRKTEDTLSLSHQSQKSKAIVKDVTLPNRVGGSVDKRGTGMQRKWCDGGKSAIGRVSE